MSLSQSDFDAFWDHLDRQLAALPADLTLDRDDFYSKPEWHVYRAHYTGLDGYRLFA